MTAGTFVPIDFNGGRAVSAAHRHCNFFAIV
ncbi:hypothetical protein AGROH133_05916 [Agrobacterium tumefaciens]|nr:hypothetical protein AGROH133_05916 [Agrobacterium tumefaciens]